MAKNVKRVAKLQFMAGQAKPGPELAGIGIDMGPFTQDFNNATKDRTGEIVPVVITAYDDRSYDFELKTTPASFLIKREAGVDKGSARPNSENAGDISMAKIREIAEYKLVDMNTDDIEQAVLMVVGTANSLGITVDGQGITSSDDGTAKEKRAEAEAKAEAEASAAPVVEIGESDE